MYVLAKVKEFGTLYFNKYDGTRNFRYAEFFDTPEKAEERLLELSNDWKLFKINLTVYEHEKTTSPSRPFGCG